jgi:hypothetical protein
MGAQGVSKGRVFKIAWTLLMLRRNMDCTFSGANRGMIEKLIEWLNGSEFSANARSDHKKILKSSTSTSATATPTRALLFLRRYPG